MLNHYTATLHSADAAYIKNDFVAQRFMENAMAGVPVIYSDKIQPTVRSVVGDTWLVRDMAELNLKWRRLQKREYRMSAAREHSRLVLDWANQHPHHPLKVLSKVL